MSDPTPAPGTLVERLDGMLACIARTQDQGLGRCAELMAAARQRIAELEGALAACADDLEAEIKGRYGDPPPTAHRDTVRRYDRDMATVRDARAALAQPGEAG